MHALILIALASAPPLSDGQALLDDMVAKEESWRTCTAREARSMATKSREPAETIATAAMALCPKEEWDFRLSGRRRAVGLKLSTDMGDDVVDKAMAAWRGSLLAIIIKAR
jgi:hypothetical protein